MADTVESARERGFRVLETAPSEPESVLAFSGVGDLFERLPVQVFEPLTEIQARALSAALSMGELPAGSLDMQALPRAVLSVLRQLSTIEPVLIAIDDEQWLDPASARRLDNSSAASTLGRATNGEAHIRRLRRAT